MARTSLRLPVGLIISATTALVVLGLAWAGMWWLSRPPIPASIAKQLHFGVYYPASAKTVTINESSWTYNDKLAQCVFTVQYAGRSITFSQQAVPAQFTDIPEFYSKYLDKLRSSGSFENSQGRVYITRPLEVDRQTAVLNNRGTLLYAQADKDLPESDWKYLMGHLKFFDPNE